MLLLITASHSTSTTHHGGWHGLIFHRHSLAREASQVTWRDGWLSSEAGERIKWDAILGDDVDTLVNSVSMQIDITRQILAEVTPHLTGEQLPHYLRSDAEYHYANHVLKSRLVLDMDEYGLSRDKIMLAGSLWAKASHGWWFGIEKTPIIRSAFCIDVVSCGH